MHRLSFLNHLWLAHTFNCKLSWTLSLSLQSRALFSSSTSPRTEALHSWTRSSATSFSRSERSIDTCTPLSADVHPQSAVTARWKQNIKKVEQKWQSTGKLQHRNKIHSQFIFRILLQTVLQQQLVPQVPHGIVPLLLELTMGIMPWMIFSTWVTKVKDLVTSGEQNTKVVKNCATHEGFSTT